MPTLLQYEQRETLTWLRFNSPTTGQSVSRSQSCLTACYDTVAPFAELVPDHTFGLWKRRILESYVFRLRRIVAVERYE